jgi:hypothetical protein
MPKPEQLELAIDLGDAGQTKALIVTIRPRKQQNPLRRIIATPRDYLELIQVARARMRELDITLETLDHISGLAPHYSQRLIGLNPEKRFGAVSLTAIMGALGLRLVVEEDQEALARVRSRLVKRRLAPKGSKPGSDAPIDQR